MSSAHDRVDGKEFVRIRVTVKSSGYARDRTKKVCARLESNKRACARDC